LLAIYRQKERKETHVPQLARHVKLTINSRHLLVSYRLILRRTPAKKGCTLIFKIPFDGIAIATL
jgi:hypothetical protein